MNTATSLALCCLLAFCAAPVAAQVPDSISYQGLLSDGDGDPLEDPVDLTVSIWSDPNSLDVADRLFLEQHADVAVDEGVFSIAIGSAGGVPALGPELFAGGERWLELAVDGETLSPRTPLQSVPYAMRAAQADAASPGGEFVLGELGPGDFNFIRNPVDASVHGADSDMGLDFHCGDTNNGNLVPDCVAGFYYNQSHLGGEVLDPFKPSHRWANEYSYSDPDTTEGELWMEHNEHVGVPVVDTVPTGVSGGAFSAGNWVEVRDPGTQAPLGLAYIKYAQGANLTLHWQTGRGSAGDTLVELDAPLGQTTGVTGTLGALSHTTDRFRYWFMGIFTHEPRVSWTLFGSPGKTAIRAGTFSNGRTGAVVGTGDVLAVDDGLQVGGSLRVYDEIQMRNAAGKRIHVKAVPASLDRQINVSWPLPESNSKFVLAQGGPSQGVPRWIVSDGDAMDSGDEACAAADETSAGCRKVIRFGTEQSPAMGFSSCGSSHAAGEVLIALCR